MKKQIIPLSIFAVLIAFLGIGLTLNPKEVPSPLIGKPAADFAIDDLLTGENITKQRLMGKPWVLNIWASWCSSCRQEHELLVELSQKYPVRIVGLNYKDLEEEAKLWLTNLGNPYEYTLFDPNGKASIDWGVYGVPETFVIDAKGIIRHKFTGPLTKQSIEKTLVPLLNDLRTSSPFASATP